MPRRPPDDLDCIIGTNIRRLRLAHRLTQQQLGHVLGVSFQQIQKYEAGQDRMAVSCLVAAAAALGVAAEQLWLKSPPNRELRPHLPVAKSKPIMLISRVRGKLMAAVTNNDPVLKRFREALDRSYGDQIERVVLFGSRARGNARPDSDYDIAVFLKNLRSFGMEAKTLADIETDLLLETGAVIHALPLHAGAYHDRTGLMQELRQDGLDL